MNKRGLSPIVATVLLISIAVVLAGIIFIWAYSFIGESVTKQGRSIEQSCQEVQFEAEADSGDVYVNNLGDIPLWGIEIRKKDPIGDITKIDEFEDVGSITAGETAGPFSLPPEVQSGDRIIVSPILLGETETEKKKYICDEEFGQAIEV